MFRDLLSTLTKDVIDSPEFNNLKELDLRKDDDYLKFKDIIESLKVNPLFNIIESFAGVDKNMLDELLTEVDEYREECKSNKMTNENSQQAHEINRPSKNLPTNVGLQIHKLVQEYVDTMIKPYANGIMDNNAINNAYAGLYEFAAWVYLHK